MKRWSSCRLFPSILLALSCAPAVQVPDVPESHATVEQDESVAPISAPALAPDRSDPPAANPNHTDSGLSWEVVHAGTGTVHPTRNDDVEVHYEGWTSDGVRFGSSRKRNKPTKFGLGKVIRGWTEVLQLMVEGDRWRVLIPAELGYGHVPKRPGTPAGDLTFDIELLDIIAAPDIPSDVQGPPAIATVTTSGLAYRVLKKGKGLVHPTPPDKVQVHYSGWMTNGDMFDSSIMRGAPAKFDVGGVIAGWAEGLQLMVAGDIFRLWIPAHLGYGTKPKRPGAPFGMLVFDVELLAIIP